jgi:hypothetical protein
MSTVYAWHYAPWAYLPRIVIAGFLRRTKAESRRASEQPLLWFSLRQDYEPTAVKLGFGGRAMTFEEQRAIAGCIRFGMRANDGRLMRWRRACVWAGIPKSEREAMERAGRRMGADPSHWLGCASSVDVPELRFQVLLDEWTDASADARAAEWRRRGIEIITPSQYPSEWAELATFVK